MSADPHDLERFVIAQERGGTYAMALDELRAGRKRTHWMWFIFPQIDGLGASPTARRYAIASLAQARAYLAHPVLGARLRACASALAQGPGGDDPADVLGAIDALKLRSSMTLFLRADPHQPVFAAVLERYYDGAADPATDARLADLPGPAADGEGA